MYLYLRAAPLLEIRQRLLLVTDSSQQEATKTSTNCNSQTKKICSKHLKLTKGRVKRETLAPHPKTNLCLPVTMIPMNIAAPNKATAQKAAQTRKRINKFIEICLHNSA
jgi:hypothetical protein